MESMIGSLGVVFIVLLGLSVMVRGVLGGRDFGRGRQASALASLVSFAVVYKLIFDLVQQQRAPLLVMVLIAGALLLAMAFFDWVETMVSVTALVVFLMRMTESSGPLALLVFLLLLPVYGLLRHTFFRRSEAPSRN
jgi:hypothetical protein